MRFGAALVLAAMIAACGGDPANGPSGAALGGGLFKQYEYEEDMYLSLDGTATLYVNSSIPALNALRGTTFDERPNARIDRARLREYFTTPITDVTRVTATRRRGRVFVHVRIDVSDVRRLREAAPFAWSTYHFAQEGDHFVYRQKVGVVALNASRYEGWTGEEIVAFRIHVPSEIPYHNAGADNLRRGNILVWEQPFADRRRSIPLEIEVLMATESILYRTLWLFASTAAAVAAMFAMLVWWIVRRGRRSGAVVGAGR